jgi:hypothetical protein
VDHDPHADAISWHGPSVSSVTEPIDMGHFEDAEPCRVLELKAGWYAHKLNAPGKFLISAPGHGTSRRARAYLITDDGVTNTVAR